MAGIIAIDAHLVSKFSCPLFGMLPDSKVYLGGINFGKCIKKYKIKRGVPIFNGERVGIMDIVTEIVRFISKLCMESDLE
ncbi:hypothetical protein [Clostridium sp.]|uniref:hypothetical protein n=1 Tax=Clostridium sp. TaxID=1506 RepID=UPI003D6D279B